MAMLCLSQQDCNAPQQWPEPRLQGPLQGCLQLEQAQSTDQLQLQLIR